MVDNDVQLLFFDLILSVLSLSLSQIEVQVASYYKSTISV